jgi:hypothetical protein
MHVYYPRRVFYEPSNTFIDRDGSRYCEWYADPDSYEEIEPAGSYFVETRRRNYSDVFHAKLLRPGILPYECCSTYYDWFQFSSGVRLAGRHGTLPYCAGGWVCGNGLLYLYSYCNVHHNYGSRSYFQLKIYAGRFSHFTDKWKNSLIVKKLQASVYVDWDWSTGTIRSSSPTGDTEQLKNAIDSLACAIVQTAGKDRNWSAIDSVYNRLVEGGYRLIGSYIDQLSSSTKTKRITSRVEPLLHQESVGRDAFLLHEPGVLHDGEDDLFYGRGTQGYFRNVLIQNAYMNLVENVPRLNENSVSNLLEISAFIKGLVIDKKVEIPKSLSDAWLAYRYTYGTTKMDAEEAIHFVHRHMDLGDWLSLKAHGNSSIEYDGTLIRCHCVATVLPRQLDTVSRLWKKLYTYGLSPTFYIAWDMVPYSFIVDWFLPIGDILAAWDAEREMKHFYEIKDVQFSLTYERAYNKLGTVKCYSRWLAGPPPELQGRYFLEKNPSSRTVSKRVIDGAALILG